MFGTCNVFCLEMIFLEKNTLSHVFVLFSYIKHDGMFLSYHVLFHVKMFLQFSAVSPEHIMFPLLQCQVSDM